MRNRSLTLYKAGLPIKIVKTCIFADPSIDAYSLSLFVYFMLTKGNFFDKNVYHCS